MNIGNNISNLRKKFNLSQEELAEKINVSRQTISKWELNETSPGIEEAKKLSKIFNVSLDELANNDVNNIIVKKVSNTEKLAGIIINILKVFGILIALWIFLVILACTIFVVKKNRDDETLIEKSITCTIHGEEYSYSFRFYEQTGEIKEAGGDGYLANITDIENYDDAYKAIDKIDAYVKNNGGTCIKD